MTKLVIMKARENNKYVCKSRLETIYKSIMYLIFVLHISYQRTFTFITHALRD